MVKHIVKCKVCGISFDANKEPYEVCNRRYYHKECFEKERGDAVYKEKIYDYCKNLFGVSYSKTKTDRYIKQYLNEGKSYQGIYATMVYWFKVRKEDVSKANGSIGIVGYIYTEAQEYYRKKKENKNRYNDVETDKYILDKQTYNINKAKIRKPKRINFFNIR